MMFEKWFEKQEKAALVRLQKPEWRQRVLKWSPRVMLILGMIAAVEFIAMVVNIVFDIMHHQGVNKDLQSYIFIILLFIYILNQSFNQVITIRLYERLTKDKQRDTKSENNNSK